MGRNKKTVRGILVYLILTVGMWMFFYSYANSYNRLTDKKIPPAALKVDKEDVIVEVVGESFRLETDIFSPHSDFDFASYMFVPTEMRLLCTAVSAWEKEFGL